MRLEIDDGFFSYLHKAALFRLISHCLRVKTMKMVRQFEAEKRFSLIFILLANSELFERKVAVNNPLCSRHL